MRELRTNIETAAADPNAADTAALQAEFQAFDTSFVRLQDERAEAAARLLITFGSRTYQLAEEWRLAARAYAGGSIGISTYADAKDAFYREATEEIRASASIGWRAVSFTWSRRGKRR